MAPERRWHLTSPELAPSLLEELRRALPASKHAQVSPGVVESMLTEHEEILGIGLAFAAQTLPRVHELSASSVQTWARTLFDAIAHQFEGHRGPWRLHVIALDSALRGRARLIEEALIETAQSRLRRLERTRVVDFTLPWQPDEALVQVAFTGAESGVVSVALPAQRRRLDRVLSRFPGGEVRAPRDTRPPSRAYRKLLEAEVHLGRAIAANETCVDLGASPGGWTYVAIDRGARVTAVDRSELRDDLMQNARLTFVGGDAFAWTPPQPCDWLLCDLIAFPERTLELLETWLTRRLCLHFIVTIKFRGEADLERVVAVKALLDRHASGHRVIHLGANKNEVTALGHLGARPQAILFDLDGVLVRSHEAWFHLLSLAGERYRGSPLTREEFDPTFGQSIEADVLSFGFTCTTQELDQFCTDNFHRFREHLWVDPGASDLLDRCRADGLKLSVVTNTPTAMARQILEIAGLLSKFDAICCADEVPVAKPAPDLLQLALTRLGISADDAWMIGDSRYDRGAAAAAGVRFVGLGIDGDLRIETLAALDTVRR